MGLAQSLEGSFLALYTRRGADLVIQRRGGTVQISKGLPLKLADRIRRLPDVREVISGLMDLVAFEDRGLFVVIVNGWELDCPVLDRVRLIAGRRLRVGDRRHVMLGRILAANLGKRPGDVVELYAQRFEIVGVFESFSVYENGAVFMLMDELQRQMDRPGQATGFVVQANPPGDAETIQRLRAEIEALDPAIAATPCAQFVQSLKQMQVTLRDVMGRHGNRHRHGHHQCTEYHGHERVRAPAGNRRVACHGLAETPSSAIDRRGIRLAGPGRRSRRDDLGISLHQLSLSMARDIRTRTRGLVGLGCAGRRAIGTPHGGHRWSVPGAAHRLAAARRVAPRGLRNRSRNAGATGGASGPGNVFWKSRSCEAAPHLADGRLGKDRKFGT